MKSIRLAFPLLMLLLASPGKAQTAAFKPTTAGDTTWYCLLTPLRENLHLTNQGADADLTGTQGTYADNQLWCFLPAADGRFNLLSRQGRLYMADSPTGNYYRATAQQPSTGFRFTERPNGLYNITDAQGDLLNQCLASLSYKLTPYNVADDPGNQFRIERVVPDDPAFSQAMSEARSFFEGTIEGNAPGTFSKEARENFLNSLATASTEADLTAAVAAYKNEMNTVTAGQYYFIVSTGPVYCNGRVIYNTKPTAGAYLRWGDKTLDENALWEFIPADGDTPSCKLRNKATGLYISATSQPGGSGEVRGADEVGSDGTFELEPLYEDGSFLLYTSGGNPIHAQQNYGMMVTWNSRTYGTASSWKIIPATADELAAAGKKVEEEGDYRLIWSDEFEEGPINRDYWNFGEGFQRNNEDQWYQADNAQIADGNLVIEARQERRPNPWYEAGSSDWKKSREYIEYTSSILNTSGKFDFCYGRLEVRAKIPCHSGSWPAIWLLGNEKVTGPWPSSGEIDVMEYYKDKTWANLVWGSEAQWAGTWESRSTPVTGYWAKQQAGWETAYHTWRMDWDEESIKLYLDDELITICNLDRTINKGIWHLVDNPFHTNQYLLLNLALGGNNGGTIDQSNLPFHYLVDYVRVYQKPRNISGIGRVETESPAPLVVQKNGEIRINTSSFNGPVRISIYDMSGRLVLSRQDQATASGFSVPQDSLVPGIYVVQAADGSTSRTQKVQFR